MKQTMNGVLCDTETATLVALETTGGNPENPEDGFSWNRTSLFRTLLGRFFAYRQQVGGVFETIELLRRTEAMDLYDTLAEQKLDFDDAFED